MNNLKKFLTIVLVVFIMIFILIIQVNNSYCKDESHRGVFPVNPYCTKCHNRDGIKKHECSNPNGEEKYCRTCGKKLYK